MARVERIIEQARALPSRDRRKVIAALTKAEKPNGKRSLGSAKRSSTAGRRAALDSFLALAGTARCERTDVADDKYAHLADIYADPHERS